VLAHWLRSNAASRTVAVFGALSDKDVGGIVVPFAGLVDHWMLGGLAEETPRGLSAEVLRARAGDALSASQHRTIGQALDAAAASAREGETILAFGSFFVAAAAVTWAQSHGYGAASGARRV
jgi:dihydrofolate synthase/folylpolyglutamate synthase